MRRRSSLMQMEGEDRVGHRIMATGVIWKLVVLVVVLRFMIHVPWRLGFVVDFEFSVAYISMIFVDFLSWMICMVELYYKVQYAGGKKTILTASKLSFQRQCMEDAPRKGYKYSIWFYCDVVALFPYDVLLCWVDRPYFRMVYLPRLLLLGWLPKLLANVFRILEDRDVMQNIGLQRMWALFFTMALGGHIFACFFHAVSVEEACTHATWGQVDGLWESVQDGGISKVVYLKPAYTRYLRSLYWAYVTMVTTGFGDIVPITPMETIVCTLAMYVGLIISCTAIANLTLVMTNLDAAASEYQQKMDNLNKYMRYRNMPHTLSSKIRRFYEYMWKSLKGVDEKQFLKDLPKPLQQRVTGLITKDLLARVAPLRKTSALVRTILLNALEQHIYSPGDVIIEAGLVYQGVYLLARGEAHAMEKNERTIRQVFAKSEHFGVEALFHDAQASNTIKAKQYCEVYILPREKFRIAVHSQCTEKEVESMKTIVEKNIQSNAKLHRFAGVAVPASKTGFARHCMPDSKFRIGWTAMHLIFVTYYLFTLPLHLSYCPLIAELGNPGRVLWIVTDFITDIFFISDLILNFTYFGFVQDGVVVSAPHLIQDRFLSQGKLYIGILVVTALPLEILSIVWKIGTVSSFRLFKIFRLSEMIHYGKDIQLVLDSININLPTVVRRVGALNLFLIMVLHWVGCLWTLAGTIDLYTSTTLPTWINVDHNSTFLAIDHTVMVTYLRSVYWAMVAMTTLGYGDIVPQNDIETLVSVVVILIGGLVLPAIVGGLAALLSNMNPSVTDFLSKMNHLKQYMEQKHIPMALRQKIIRYYDYLWSRQGGVNESVILNDLPTTLRTEVATCINGVRIRNVPFFAAAEDALLRFLVSELFPRTFIPGDTIMQCGQLGHEMFLIERGILKIMSADKKIQYATLEKGDYFGEAALLSASQRNATVVAETYCDCFVLSKESFDMASDLFPCGCDLILESLRGVQKKKTVVNTVVSKNFSAHTKLKLTVAGDGSFTGNQDSRFAKHFLPWSNFRKIWNFFMLTVIMYNGIVIPVRIAFPEVSRTSLLDFLCDALLVLDTVFRLKCFSYMRQGMLHLKQADIQKNYRNKPIFVFDVFANLPFDLLAVIIMQFMANPAYNALPYLRIPKLLRLTRIVKHIENFNEALTQAAFVKDIGRVKLIELVLGVIFIAHWAGCFFYFVAWATTDLETCSLLDDITFSNTYTMMTKKAACKWKETWIQGQINRGLLPSNGGIMMDRYIRALNWAIPTLVVVVIGDVIPINVSETLYCLIWMYVGVTINAVIIGNIANLVTNLANDSSSFVQRMDNIKNYMHHNRVPGKVQHRVHHYLDFIWHSKGGLNEQQIVHDLPISLQMAVFHDIRLNMVKSCPFFEYCGMAILRDMAQSLIPQLYSSGDTVVEIGDMGQEMYLIQSGSMEVLGPDGTVYAKLPSGAYFGEIALFFSAKRTASIRSDDFSEVLVLRREDFDYILATHKYDHNKMLEVFHHLQDNNKRRNQNVERNVRRGKVEGTKLHRILAMSSQMQILSDNVADMNPKFVSNSNFRAFWDISSLFGILYQVTMIPFLIPFMDDKEMTYEGFIIVSYMVDAFFVVDMYLRDQKFSFIEKGRVIRDLARIRLKYRREHIQLDLIALLPLDIFAIIFGVQFLPIFQLLRLVRIKRISTYFRKIDRYLNKWRFQISSAATKLVHAVFYVLLINHWYACFWIVIYRHFEHFDANTWAGHDNLSNNGQPKFQRYIRAIYYVLTTISTVGFGDIKPWTNLETCFQLVVVITGACLFAGIIGQITAYFQYIDADGTNSFKVKMNVLRNYMNYRDLPDGLQVNIVAHFTHLWDRKKCLDETEITQDLPIPIRMDLAACVNHDVLSNTPVLCNLSVSLQKRIALAFKPQLVSGQSYVYHEGDLGHDLYFIGKGTVRRTISTTIEHDEHSITSKTAWREHSEESDGILISGEYFGEEGLCSVSGLRNDSVYSLSYAELYLLSRDVIDVVFTCLCGTERLDFVRSLLRMPLVFGDMDAYGNKRRTGRKLSVKTEKQKSRMSILGLSRKVSTMVGAGKFFTKRSKRMQVVPTISESSIENEGNEYREEQHRRSIKFNEFLILQPKERIEMEKCVSSLTAMEIAQGLVSSSCARFQCGSPLYSDAERAYNLCETHKKWTSRLRRRSSYHSSFNDNLLSRRVLSNNASDTVLANLRKSAIKEEEDNVQTYDIDQDIESLFKEY